MIGLIRQNKNPDLIGKTREQLIFFRIAPRIISFLEKTGQPATEKSLLTSVIGRQVYIASTLKWLVENRRIDILGTGVRADPYRYKLHENTPYEACATLTSSSRKSEEVEFTI